MKKLSVIAVLLLVAAGASAGSTNLTVPEAGDITLLDGSGGAIGAGVVDIFDDGGNGPTGTAPHRRRGPGGDFH